MKNSWLLLVIVLSLVLASCAGGSSTTDAAPASSGEEPAAAPAEPEASPTPEMSDVPIFAGAENYRSTGDGLYISYAVPDTTVEVVGKFYQEQLAAAGWEQKSSSDSGGFAGSLSITRSKPDKTITVAIDPNAVNNGVRVLITTIPK